jgi:hypothetical protein
MARSKRVNGTLFERWVDKVLVDDGCWEWQAAHHRQGYGEIGVGGHSTLAHRVSYALLRGPVPRWLCVLHSCDNTNCVRPSHLFLGTQTDNIHDMISKGRQNFSSFDSERNPKAKLTRQEAKEIRSLCAEGGQTAEISRAFGVSHNTVRDIAAGRTWRNV